MKHALIVFSLVIALVVAAAPKQATNSMLMTEAEIAALEAADTSVDADTLEDSAKSDGGGNAFVRALKAPFKAIGRLFGGGKKKDDNKFHRLTDKDVKQFKTLPNPRLIKVENADKPAATAAVTGDAKSHIEAGR